MNRKASYFNPAYAHDEGVTPEFRRPSNCTRTKPKHLTFKEKIMQQKLDAWRPVYEPISMISFLFLISVVFVVLGFIMKVEIHRVLEIEKHLTCIVEEELNDTVTPRPECNYTYFDQSESVTGRMIPCTINNPTDLVGDIVMMYRISNFYQNYRTYESDVYQEALLHSKVCNNTDESTSDNNFLENFSKDIVKFFENKLTFLPRVKKRCGAGYDFMYQDTFTITMNDQTENGTEVPLTQEGIVQDDDRHYYKNPEILKNSQNYSDWNKTFSECEIVYSTCWKTPIYKLDTKNFTNNGLMNADYLVWKRRAAFSTFIKPYRKIKKIGTFRHGLPQGQYTISGQINTQFCPDKNITKQVMITVTSWLGIRKLWFAWMYIIVGGMGIFLTVCLIFSHYKFGKTLDQKCNDSLPIVFF